MKKTALCLMTLGLSLTFHPLQTNAATIAAASTSIYSDSAEANNVLLLRLNEIKDMDKSNLSASDKKALRKEVRSLKKEVRSNNNGIYLSVGAIIIIILLLILIL
jgi:hypothetical protein